MADPLGPANVLPCRSSTPSRREKGARGAGQGCRMRTFTTDLGSGISALHLRVDQGIAPVELPDSDWSPEACHGGRRI